MAAKEHIKERIKNISVDKQQETLLRYISYLQEKLDITHWVYNKYEQWREINDK